VGRGRGGAARRPGPENSSHLGPCGTWSLARAPAVFRYEVYVRIVVDDPAPLTGAEAVLTAARPRGCGAD